MSTNTPTSLLHYQDLCPVWKEFYQDVVMMGYGEIHNCIILGDQEIVIEDWLPKTAPPYAQIVFNSNQVLSAQWNRFHTDVHRRPRASIPLIKVSEGSPSSYTISEGGRRYKAGA